MAGFLSPPVSFASRQNDFYASSSPVMFAQTQPHALMPRSTIASGGDGGGEHPSIWHIGLLVLEAVLEVVCVSLPGYIIARAGMFDKEMQKFVANLNVSLFTPCLIFTKLASQLTLERIVDLAVIPVIFVVMTAVSYLCSVAVSRAFGFEKRARNFVIAMGVFGNSNSLPISLVLSLSMTISGLHWDRIPGDNDNEVAARGILYLLIFQQLGQLVRWSWGYHVLLAPPKAPEIPAPPTVQPYRDDPADESEDSDGNDLEAQDVRIDPFASPKFENSYVGLHRKFIEQGANTADAAPVQDPRHLLNPRHHLRSGTTGTTDSAFASGGVTPYTGSSSSATSTQSTRPSSPERDSLDATPTQGNGGVRDITSFPRITERGSSSDASIPRWYGTRRAMPRSVARVFSTVWNIVVRVYTGFMAFMNPPLWAMFAAVIVASIPSLQHLFFTKGTFIQNSVTRAVAQSGNVAVPLILVVLGANLAGNTQPSSSATADKEDTKILVAAVLSRMVLPFVITAPMIALAAKFLPISIMDDPIFVIVCFLLAGSPSALQLAQICQINGVYEKAMARVLFWSYVVIILPSTLVLVVSAIEVVHWAM